MTNFTLLLPIFVVTLFQPLLNCWYSFFYSLVYWLGFSEAHFSLWQSFTKSTRMVQWISNSLWMCWFYVQRFVSWRYVNAVCYFLTLHMSLFFRKMSLHSCHHKNACLLSQETVCRGEVNLRLQKWLQILVGNMHIEDSQHVNLLCSLLNIFII